MGDKGEKTRARICREAYGLFAKKGFKEVTMTDICRKTGLSRGGLYRYYSGTEEIFAEILSEEYKIDGRIQEGERAKDILRDLLKSIREEIMEKELSLSLAIYEYASLGNEELFIRMNEKAKRRWMSLILYGMKTGEFKEIEPEQVSEMILYYYQGLRMWSRVIPFEKQTAEWYVKTVWELLVC